MKKIMIIDDNEDLARDLGFCLETEGYAVEYAFNGRQGLDMLLNMERLPDLVVLDLLMPGMDGEALIKEYISERVDNVDGPRMYRRVPFDIVVLTGTYTDNREHKKMQGRLLTLLTENNYHFGFVTKGGDGESNFVDTFIATLEQRLTERDAQLVNRNWQILRAFFRRGLRHERQALKSGEDSAHSGMARAESMISKADGIAPKRAQEAYEHARQSLERLSDTRERLINLEDRFDQLTTVNYSKSFMVSEAVKDALRFSLLLHARASVAPNLLYDELEGDFGVSGDYASIIGVIMNVFMNSMQWRNQFFDLNIGISAAKYGDYNVLSISDNGAGMNEQTLSQIFNPYFTMKPDPEIPGYERPAGLGMSIAQLVMEEYGGMIKVRSELGKGTTVNLYFPDS